VIGKDVDAGERDVEVAIVLLTIKKNKPLIKDSLRFTWLWRAAIPWLKFQASGKWLTTNGSFGLPNQLRRAVEGRGTMFGPRSEFLNGDLDQILLLVQKIDDGS